MIDCRAINDSIVGITNIATAMTQVEDELERLGAVNIDGECDHKSGEIFFDYQWAQYVAYVKSGSDDGYIVTVDYEC